MGSIIAQRVWRQHPDVVGGLILAATTDHFRANGRETVFHSGMEFSMGGAARALQVAHRALGDPLDGRGAGHRPDRHRHLGPNEWRSTSPWAMAQAVAALGRHHSTPWLSRIDVPTAVVIPAQDHVIPAERQRRLAGLIPGATHPRGALRPRRLRDAGRQFVPVFLEAANVTAARMRDRKRTGA